MVYGTKSHSAVSSFKLRASCSWGFSLVETIAVLAVITILSALAYGAFTNLNRAKTLENQNTSVLLLLRQARSLTLGSKESNQYGVHFETDAVTLYRGSTYSAVDPLNITMELGPSVQIGDISLTGGGSEVLFEWLTGKTAESGTVTLELVADPTDFKTITIHPTGLAE